MKRTSPASVGTTAFTRWSAAIVCLAVVGVFSARPVAAQAGDAGEIRGGVELIFDDAARQSWPSAEVILTDVRGRAVSRTRTDALGVFEFTDVPAGGYLVSIKDPDGLRQIHTVSLQGGQAATAGLSVPVTGEPVSIFRRAIKAMESHTLEGQHYAVVLLTHLSMSANQAAQSVRLYGMRFEAFMPHSYLVVALDKTNQCPTSLQMTQAEDEAAGSTRIIALLRRIAGKPCPRAEDGPESTGEPMTTLTFGLPAYEDGTPVLSDQTSSSEIHQ